MQKIYINYANNDFKIQQQKNAELALLVGKVDTVIQYSPTDIDNNFYKANKKILSKVRGGGYWLWKFYFIHKTLIDNNVKNGDVIFYADSGTDVLKDLSDIYKYPGKYNQDVILFSDVFCSKFTKRDAFILMNCDNQGAYYAPMCAGTFNVWRKSKNSISFIEQCLKYACDERILTDSRSQLGEELSDFMMHRHDQCVFSLMAYKCNLKTFNISDNQIYGYEENGVLPNTYLMAKRAHNRSKFMKMRYKISMLPEKFWRYGGVWGYLKRQFLPKNKG